MQGSSAEDRTRKAEVLVHSLPTHSCYFCNAPFISLCKIPTFLQICAISRQVWVEALSHLFGRLSIGQEEGQSICYHLALWYHPLLSLTHTHDLNRVVASTLLDLKRKNVVWLCSKGHKFCKQPCLQQWLRTNPICPVCRAPMDPTARKTTDRANRGIKKQRIVIYLVFVVHVFFFFFFFFLSSLVLWVVHYHIYTLRIILRMFWNEDDEGRIRGRDYRRHIMPFELSMLHRRYYVSHSLSPWVWLMNELNLKALRVGKCLWKSLMPHKALYG